MHISINISGFDWDEGNWSKNQDKHGVTPPECEEIFFNAPLVVGDDEGHSTEENRYFALGRTDSDRLLFIVYTVRRDRIRVISARDMSRKERAVYNERL
jgi:uncharacterized protein